MASLKFIQHRNSIFAIESTPLTFSSFLHHWSSIYQNKTTQLTIDTRCVFFGLSSDLQFFLNKFFFRIITNNRSQWNLKFMHVVLLKHFQVGYLTHAHLTIRTLRIFGAMKIWMSKLLALR